MKVNFRLNLRISRSETTDVEVEGVEILESSEVLEGLEILEESSWDGNSDGGLDTSSSRGSSLGARVGSRDDVVNADVTVSRDGWVESNA